MSLELYMIGLVVQDMSRSLEFYRRLGLAIPEASAGKSHVQIKMDSGVTLFLDANPSRWDPHFVWAHDTGPTHPAHMKTVLEFYLKSRIAVDEKYAEMIGYGYQSHAAPYNNGFGMWFAMVNDPDGNTILLSGDLET